MKASSSDSRVRAVLGPTNTGKTHLAIERMCGHSSGAIGFPLRLLAREVYDKVCAIKGENQVALITGEERIEPRDSRYWLCTAEAMPRDGGGRAFVALDEAQLAADSERGHVFTDRLLNARGREETMLLGSATMEPMIRALVPDAEIEGRPRFSTLSHSGSCKLSRLPPRSAIVAFSAEQVYAVAEMLRRFRGGAAVVMGGLSPGTRNRQVELYQSGEVDYIVATDAIGMGLNLDVNHVAFAALSKFDGRRRRRLTPAELAQIAGRAGRHHRDGTFGSLAGAMGGAGAEFTSQEVYAIEEHRFEPLTRLFWREAQPRCESLFSLIDDLERSPEVEQLSPAPEAVDLAVLRRLAQDPDLAAGVATPDSVRRFWALCQLPDFRQQGAEVHSRFVARLWRDLRTGALGADYVSGRIADLDRAEGDIDTLQGRISAIRSWAYICQRDDWVQARDEMSHRARAAEARLSDALHQRLTERFVNRRSGVLMKALGKDAGLLRVALTDKGLVTVEGEPIGRLEGFRFVVDGDVGREERKLLLAAAEKHLPGLLSEKARQLVASDLGELRIAERRVWRGEQAVASIARGKSPSTPRLALARELGVLHSSHRSQLEDALRLWFEDALGALGPLRMIERGSGDMSLSGEVRALLLALIEGVGVVARDGAGLALVAKDKRPSVRRLGITIGALDVFVAGLLKPEPRRLLAAIGLDSRPLRPRMEAVIEAEQPLPAGYRLAGDQAIRVDMAEKLFRHAHEARARGPAGSFLCHDAVATSMGLRRGNFVRLMNMAGFRARHAPDLVPGASGPPAPLRWSWKPERKRAPVQARPTLEPRESNVFAALADLVR